MAGPRDRSFLAHLWAALGGAPDRLLAVTFEGLSAGLPSVYAVNEGAAALVAATTLAVAELHAARSGGPMPGVAVDRRHVAAAFRSERYLRPVGWALPPAWDPIAGDYEARDRWIRLHTNYAWHRDAVLRVLGTAADRAAVTEAVRGWCADALEAAVVESGGCAAVMRTTEEWSAHPQGAAVAGEPLVHVARVAGGPLRLPVAQAPLAGVRVLDLTRVIAGPVCTRVLAWYGADVMRIDPPGFDEVGSLLGDTTVGKRRAFLDLRSPAGRAAFERLVEDAHVLVSGFRPDALRRLGYSTAPLRALNPALILASHDAYGHTGAWSQRRGFDSLVQMSCGTAARGKVALATTHPAPLPAQALDHGTGYLVAAAVCRALTHAVERGETSEIRASLARTARWLVDLGDDGDPAGEDFTADAASPWLTELATAWGPLGVVRCPGRIAGTASGWARAPGPLGTDAPAWT